MICNFLYEAEDGNAYPIFAMNGRKELLVSGVITLIQVMWDALYDGDNDENAIDYLGELFDMFGADTTREYRADELIYSDGFEAFRNDPTRTEELLTEVMSDVLDWFDLGGYWSYDELRKEVLGDELL